MSKRFAGFLASIGGVILGLLLLASQSVFAADASKEWKYTVADGDTLIGLTETLLKPPATWSKLQRINQIADPLHLKPGSTLRIPTDWLRGDATVAELIHMQGSVQVQRGGNLLSGLAVGANLRAGDQIRTGAQSTLTLKFIDGSRLLVSPDSKLSIESLLIFGKTRMTETRLQVEAGGIDSHVAQQQGTASRYEVRTPSLNLGVRGTDFQVRVDAQNQVSRSEVLEGRVAAQGANAQVLVNAGFGTVSGAGGEPQAPRPLLGAPELRGISQKLERVPLRFAWEPVKGAKAYRAQVFADRSLDQLLLDSVFAQPGARWQDLPDGSYVLRVRSVDDAGLEGLTTLMDFVLKARPEPPFTSLPAEGGKVYGDSAQFKWTVSSKAERYRLQVSDSADFKQLRLDKKDLSNSEFTLALAPGNYFWRIASIARGDDQGPFSDTLGFIQRKIPESPALEAPSVGEKELSFRWKAREPGQTFQYQMAADAEFKTVLIDKAITEPVVVLAKPEPGVYYLRVKTIDADGFAGPFGAAQQFEIKGTPWWNYLPLVLLLLIH